MAENRPPYDCPCCGFPTLEELSTAVCDICWWQVSGPMSEAEDEISGGPNHGYSLNMARANFRDHGHMYDVGKEIAYLKKAGEARRRLMAYVTAVLSGERKLERNVLDACLAAERAYQRADVPQASGTEEDEQAMLKALMADRRDRR